MSAMTVEACVEDFLARLRAGERLDVEAFALAHPAVADELRELLPLLAALENNGSVADDDETVPESPPDLTGSDFRLERLLGRGGMGSVWAARQLSLDRLVAVKVLPAPRDRTAHWQDDFAREARIVAQLHHPNIVKVYGAGVCGDFGYYAMECVAGGRFDYAAFADVRACVEAVRQAAEALAYAHRCGVLHRDIKPSNLMLDADGTVRVTDFGLAVLAEEAAEADARDGTLRYMAPERLASATASFAADQYALGVTLWELLMRRALFRDAYGSVLRRRICEEGVPPLEGDRFDADLRAVVAKATARRSEDRYADMTAFGEDLRRWLDHTWVLAAPPSWSRRMVLWARRRPASAALVGVAVLFAGAFAAACVMGYVRTVTERNRVVRTVSVADGVLQDVFRHVSSRPPSRDDATLLAALLPYYERLAYEGGKSPEKIVSANEILGACAFRAGDFARAEEAWRCVADARPSASVLNRLADLLRRRGKSDAATALRERVVAEYGNSVNRAECLEAVRAQAELGRRIGRVNDLREAWKRVCTLVCEEPENPDYRFLEALLRADLPRAVEGKEIESAVSRRAEAVRTLLGLLDECPARTDFGCALLALELRRLRNPREGVTREEAVRVAAAADRLLGRFANVPDVVGSGLAYRSAYAAFLRRQGARAEAAREEARTTGILEMLAHNPESPDAVRQRFSCEAGTVDYRQIVVKGMVEDEKPLLVLILHDRTREGTDGLLQMTAPYVQSLVDAVRRRGKSTVVLVPQCPRRGDRHWGGSKADQAGKLLTSLASLVQAKQMEFEIPVDRTVLVGMETGTVAANALRRMPEKLFSRYLLAGNGEHGGGTSETETRQVPITTIRRSYADFVFDADDITWLLDSR